MARFVTVSAIGARPPAVDPACKASEAVEVMTSHLTAQIAQVWPDQPDLIVLPEVCDLPANYEETSEQTLKTYLTARGERILHALADLARAHHSYITYPALRALPDGTWRNSIQLIDRRGVVAGVYDKCHPTIWENEAGILSGAHAVIAECDFGRVGFGICFDLNFDELRRQYAQARPDVLVFSSIYHGGLMQAYWAYSCRAHFVGAITGTGGYVLSPLGERIAASTNYFNYISTRVNLDCCVAHLDYNWERLNALRARYGPRVKVIDPGFLGSVLISSETDEVGIDRIIEEFGIELLDDYFTRALAFQAAHRPVNNT
jgi:predicted amidohydrolase